MGIKIFIYTLFVFAVAAYFYEIDLDINKAKKEERPLVTFKGATMYSIDESQVKRVVQADTAAVFDNRDELFEATIVERSNDKENTEATDTIRANFIERKGEFVTLKGNVKYNRSSSMVLTTDELFYNSDKKEGYNEKPFEMIYNEQKLTGTNIKFSAQTNMFEAQKTHFEIEVKDNNETN